jgi:hypothetical protein
MVCHVIFKKLGLPRDIQGVEGKKERVPTTVFLQREKSILKILKLFFGGVIR